MSKVIVFDLDDTLYLERQFVRSGFRAVDAWIRDRYAVSGFFERAWALFESGHRGDIFDRVLPMLGIDAAADVIPRLVAVYRNHAPSIALAPDAAVAFRSLEGRSHLALLTDGHYETQRRKVETLGLADRLRPIVYTDCLGNAMWKPHPRGFIALQEWFSLPADRFAYVADNPRKDFVAPRELGWRTIRVRRPLGEHFDLTVEQAQEADRTVGTLDEVDWEAL